MLPIYQIQQLYTKMETNSTMLFSINNSMLLNNLKLIHSLYFCFLKGSAKYSPLEELLVEKSLLGSENTSSL